MKARILSIPREFVYVVLLAFTAFSLTLSYQLNSINLIIMDNQSRSQVYNVNETRDTNLTSHNSTMLTQN